MDFISNLPQNKLNVIKDLTKVGFVPELMVRKSSGDRQEYVVLHHGKTACAVYFDLAEDILYVGPDNKVFEPDLEYALTVSGRTSKELVELISNAASEYTIRAVGSFEDEIGTRMFESANDESSLFVKAGLNIQNSNYARAWEIMSKVGLPTIGGFIAKHDGDENACATAAASIRELQSISRSSWKHIILVYKKVSAYLATTANVGDKVAQNNEDNDIDNIPVLNSSRKQIVLDREEDVDDENINDGLSEEEQEKRYRDALEDLAQYVTSAVNVVVKKKKDRMFMTRCCLVTGTSGSSKTYTVESVLEKLGMKKGTDYYLTNLAANTAQALYNMLYTYNGKIIVLDDASHIFSGGNRIAFWKACAEPKSKQLDAPAVDAAKANTLYYDPASVKSRKDRFFKEAGIKEEAEDSPEGRHRVLKRTQKGIPSNFRFDGSVIIISNQSLSYIEKDVMKTSGSKQDWEAVAGRLKLITLAPSPKALWAVMKEVIENDVKNPALNDDIRCINSEFAADVIKEVETIMAENETFTLQWRIITQLRNLLAPSNGDMPANIDTIWKRELRRLMLPQTEF